jgi:TPR repeat protein
VAFGMALGDHGLSWLERAAAQGSLVAVKQLHIHFASNAVLTKDPGERSSLEERAAHWAHEGAKLNDVDLQRALGDYFAEGKGVRRDDVAAVQWWRAAAENGSSFAQSSLSKALFEGRGTGRDHVEALKWAMLAAQKIKGPSFGRLQVVHLPGLKNGLSDAEIALAEENARAWLAQHAQRQRAKHDANQRECGIRQFDIGAVR